MAIAWRITKRKHLRTAFSGEGARLFGGRWNSPGIPVVYLAESQALAVLEVLIHLDDRALLEKYVLVSVEIDDSLFANVNRSLLPGNWNEDPAPREVQAIGDRWVAGKTTLALRVASTQVPGEHNFLLNPTHPDYSRIVIGDPLAYRFDRRLTSGTRATS